MEPKYEKGDYVEFYHGNSQTNIGHGLITAIQQHENIIAYSINTSVWRLEEDIIGYYSLNELPPEGLVNSLRKELIKGIGWSSFMYTPI